MKLLHKVFSVLSFASLLLAGCTEPIAEVPVTVKLNKTLISAMPLGSEQQLTAVVSPEDADVTVTWTSDNEKIATVSSTGMVTAVSLGTAKITASAEESSATCEVTVVALKPEEINLNHNELILIKGDEETLSLQILPEGAVAEDLEWLVDDKSVISFKDGKVTALEYGEAKITARCNGGSLASVCKVSVVEDNAPILLTGVEFNPTTLSLYIGQNGKINVKFTPADAPVYDMLWKSDNEEVATVKDGMVTAVGEGDATITLECNGGEVSASCSVTVEKKPEEGGEDTSFTLTIRSESSDLQVGRTVQLEAVYYPATAKPKTVKWSVDNETYATVDDNGLVTGVYASRDVDENWVQVNVTLKADDQEATIPLRVIPLQPTDISLTLPETAIKVGEEWNLNPSIIPEELNGKFTLSKTLESPMGVENGIFMSGTPGEIRFGYYISEATYPDCVYQFIRHYYITVEPYWVESISLEPTLELDKGSAITLVPSFESDVQGREPSYKDVTWKSTDENVVKVDESGTVTAVGVGSADVIVTTTSEWAVPDGQPQKSATCTVTVKESAVSLNVGDYLYSDGTWSSELVSGKTVVGIVFSKANATGSDPILAKDYPDCVHGLAVGLAEYADQDFGHVSTYYGHDYYKGIGYDPNMIVDTGKPNGYGNTYAHKSLNASKSDYCLFFNQTDGVVAAHTSAVPAPSTASAWYIPSYKEMSYIVENLDVVNTALEAAGGTPIAEPYEREESFDEKTPSDWYWTSTIYGKWYANGGTYDHFKYPFDISKNGWTTYLQSSAKCKVRVVLAF